MARNSEIRVVCPASAVGVSACVSSFDHFLPIGSCRAKVQKSAGSPRSSRYLDIQNCAAHSISAITYIGTHSLGVLRLSAIAHAGQVRDP
jgi:hypothetical protein